MAIKKDLTGILAGLGVVGALSAGTALEARAVNGIAQSQPGQNQQLADIWSNKFSLKELYSDAMVLAQEISISDPNYTGELTYIGKKDEHAPDLMIYFDDLQYGCNNTLIGNETLWSPQTAKGSDDAGHSKQGIFIMNDGKHEQGDIGEVSYLDVAPTVLNLMDIPVPEDMKGKIIGTL